MTNFVIGAIVGFLICVWAVDTTPNAAFSALWTKLERVQAMSAAANQAYDAMKSATQDERQGTHPLLLPAEPRADPAIYR